MEAPSAGWGQRMLHGSLSGLGFHFGEYERMAMTPAASPALPLDAWVPAGCVPSAAHRVAILRTLGGGVGSTSFTYTHPDSFVAQWLLLFLPG